MKRRRFIHAATASLLLPTALKPSVSALASGLRNRDYVFFDERFQNARHIAASWAGSTRLIGVQGDITPLWSNGLDSMTRDQPLNLLGVTTESFHFCLRILVGEHADFDLQLTRLDRNLFLWTMHTTPKATAERRYG